MVKKTLISAYEDYIDQQTQLTKEDKMSKNSENAINETNAILQEIEDHLWYDMPTDEKDNMKQQRAYSGEVIYALTKVLVEKGLLTFDDVAKTLRKNK